MNVHRPIRLLVLSVALIVAAGTVAAGAGAASASTCVNWTGVTPVHPTGNGDNFEAVAMPSPCDAWAVGEDVNNGHFNTLVEHWNGTGWQFELSGNPGGVNQNSFLIGVAAVPGASPWAAGFYSNGVASQTLIETPKDGVWQQVPTKNPGGPSDDNIFYAVAATSASNAWAVGLYGAIPQSTLIERWNGSAWSQVRSPDPSATQNILYGVAATSARNAWAVGQYVDSQTAWQTLALRWNGTVWKRVPSQNPAGPANTNQLLAVAPVSASSAWAVGDEFTGGVPQPLIERWDGTEWKSVHAPSPSLSVPAELTGVTAVSASDAWAVGDYGSSGATHTLIEHWNGKAWHRVPSPSPGISAVLRGVASSGTSIWAVGHYGFGGPSQALAINCC
jgi:hypothetical protein